MYDPLALDRHRIDDERLRRRAEEQSRRLPAPRPADNDAPHPGKRRMNALLRLRARPAGAPCAGG